MQSPNAQSAPPPLASFNARNNAALFLDFDGTLVELAEKPDAIAPLPDLAVRLLSLSKRLGGRLAIVSGRAIEDIERHTGPLLIPVAGSHGSDVRGPGGQMLGGGAVSMPRAIEDELRRFAETHGLDYEHKPHGGALHYRTRPELGEQAHAFAESLASKHGWSVQSGKCVAELIAKGRGKGGAVQLLMDAAPFTGARPVFIGDDLTDEAGFRAAAQLGGFGVIVGDIVGDIAGDRPKTCAQYRLSGVAAVHTWLEL